MFLRMPFFGLIAQKSPMEGLSEHYHKIAEGMTLIEEALECYLAGGTECTEFAELIARVENLEDEADKVKRKIRNHLPRGLFMPVDKTLFFNYTRSQDNILDDGQEALSWLYMRSVPVSDAVSKRLTQFVPEVMKTVKLLGQALDSTIDLLDGKHFDREKTKSCFRDLRMQHKLVFRKKNDLLGYIYNLDQDFKDLYQLIHFVNCLNSMSHNSEFCADMLRAMIAR